MLTLSLILIILLKCNSFIIPVNKNNNIFTNKMFEKEDFIREDIIKNENKLQELDKQNEILNQTLIETNNSVIRSGRSLDQDGKTNIWSIEPTMIVDETKEKNLFKLFG